MEAKLEEDSHKSSTGSTDGDTSDEDEEGHTSLTVDEELAELEADLIKLGINPNPSSETAKFSDAEYKAWCEEMGVEYVSFDDD